MRGFQTPKAPGNCAHPLIHFMWKEMVKQQASQEDVAARSGISSSAIRKWRNTTRLPRLDQIEAVLNALGYHLAVVGEDNNRPTMVVKR